MLWIDEKFAKEFPGEAFYRYSFSEELFARNELLNYWSSLKQQSPSTHDQYLDQFLTVRDAGFLREYVWSYFQTEGWWDKPHNLRIEDFLQWQRENQPDHQAQTRATVAVNDSTTPPLGPRLSGQTTTNSKFIPGTPSQEAIVQDGFGAEQRTFVLHAQELITKGQLDEAESVIDQMLSFFRGEIARSQSTPISVANQKELDVWQDTHANGTAFLWIDWAFPKALHLKAFILVSHNQMPTALTILEEESRIAPYQAPPHIERGYIYGRLKKPDLSLKSYEEALRLTRTYQSASNFQATALRGVGFALIELNDLDRAERSFTESLEIEPGNPNAENELRYIRHLKASRN